MKRILPALLASVFFLSSLNQTLAEDPSLVFLGAYQEFQAGEDCERNGQLREALNRYTSTKDVLEKIRKSNPDWQSMVVEYRLRKSKEAIERLLASIDRGQVPPATQSPDPLQSKGFEIDIPAPKISTSPSTKSGPQVVVPSSTVAQDLGIVKELAEARAELNRLRSDLASVKAELTSSRMEVEKVKTELVATKSTLAQAEVSLESATIELKSLQAKADLPPDEKVLKLSSRIADLESENSFLKDDRERLSGKLRRASDYIRETESNLSKVLADRNSVAKERDNALSKIQKLKDNDAELDSLRNENAKLTKKADSIRADLEKRLSTQATELEKMAELQRINGELALRLDRTEKALTLANEEKLGRAQLELLNNELSESQSRLDAVRNHVQGGEASTRLLFAQLEQTTSKVTQLGLDPQPSPEQQNLIEEGKLLKEIILAQINEQNNHLKTASELEAKIGELQAKQNELTGRLASLAQPTEETDASFAVVKKVENNSQPLPNSEIAPPIAPSPAATPLASPSPRPVEAKPVPASPPKIEKRQDPVTPESVGAANTLPPSIKEADRLLSEGNALEAEKIYNSLIKGSPNDPALLTSLAIAQLALGRNTLSTGTLKKVLEIKPGDIPASMNLANAQTRLGNVGEAARILLEVLQKDPKNAVAYNYLGVAYGKTRGKHLDAREAYEKSVELDKKFQNAHFNLAVSYARTAPTSLEMAKKHYEMAKKLGATPDSALEKMLEGVDPAR